MKPVIYKSRFDKRYITDVLKRLNNLQEEACDATGDDSCIAEYPKRAEISYVGISGSLLLGSEIKYQDKGNNVAEKFETIINDLETLNKQGVILDVKILLTYPYSDFTRQLIIAGSAAHRVMMASSNRNAIFVDFQDYAHDYSTGASDLKNFQEHKFFPEFIFSPIHSNSFKF